MQIRYGGIYTADLNPRFGTEAGKIRPVLVIQSDLLNASAHPSTLICCLTSDVKKEAQVLRVHLKKGEAGLGLDSDIMIDQIRAIDNRRFKKKLGQLSDSRLGELSEKLRTILEL